MSNIFSYILFLRHGDADTSDEAYPDHHKIGLSEKGRRQACEVAAAFVSVRIDRLISSPLPRAVQTAEVVIRGHPVPIELEPRLEERVFRPLYGRRYDDIAANFGVQTVEAIQTGKSDTLNLGGGETLSSCAERVRAAMNEIAGTPAKVTLVVAHGGPHEWYVGSLLSGGIHFDRRWLSLGKCRVSVFKYCAYEQVPYRILGMNLSAADAANLLALE
jgi:broad specificity phosphatase PhoE